MMKRVGYIIESIANLGGYFSGWLVPVMMVLVLFEVVMRYVVRQPPVIADEVTAAMLVAISFLAMGYTWKMKGHVRVTALVDRLPSKVSSWIRLLALLLAFGYVVMLNLASYEYLRFSYKIHMASATLRFPLQGPQMTLLIGFVVLAFLLLVEIARAIVKMRSGQNLEVKP